MSQFYCSEDEIHGESGAWQGKFAVWQTNRSV